MQSYMGTTPPVMLATEVSTRQAAMNMLDGDFARTRSWLHT